MVECLPRDYSSRGRTLARSHQKCSHKVAAPHACTENIQINVARFAGLFVGRALDTSAPFPPVLQGAAATLEVLSMVSNWCFFFVIFLCEQDKSN